MQQAYGKIMNLTEQNHKMRKPANRFNSPVVEHKHNSKTILFVYLARAACMPRGLYVLRALGLIYSFFSYYNKLWARNSGSIGPIFTKFLPHGRYSIIGCRFDPFWWLKIMLPWQPILGSKLATLDYSLLFVALAFGNGLQYCTSDFNRFIYDDLATSCRHLVLVNIDSSTRRILLHLQFF